MACMSFLFYRTITEYQIFWQFSIIYEEHSATMLQQRTFQYGVISRFFIPAYEPESGSRVKPGMTIEDSMDLINLAEALFQHVEEHAIDGFRAG